MDRTCRNTNMLVWHKELWLIDHGASLYFHHSWQNWREKATQPFALIKDHVLLKRATELDQVNEEFRLLLTDELITSIINLIPDEWLIGVFDTTDEHRQAYAQFLQLRIANSAIFVNEAQHARKGLI
jgi:hypothetical protein